MAFFKRKNNSASEVEETTPKAPAKTKLSKEEREKRKRVKDLLSRGGESVPDQFVRSIVDGLKKGLAYRDLSDAQKESYVIDDDFIDHRYGIYDEDGNIVGIHTLGLYLKGIPNIYNKQHEDSNSLIKAMRDSHLDSLRTHANIYEETILLVPNFKTLSNLADFMFIAQAKPVEGQDFPLWFSVVDTEVTTRDDGPYVNFKDIGPMTLDSYQDFATVDNADHDDILTPKDLAHHFTERAENLAKVLGYRMAEDEAQEAEEAQDQAQEPSEVVADVEPETDFEEAQEPIAQEQDFSPEVESTPMTTETTPDSFDAVTSAPEESENDSPLVSDADFEGEEDYGDMPIEQDDEYGSSDDDGGEYQVFPAAAPVVEQDDSAQTFVGSESNFEVGTVLEQPSSGYINSTRVVEPIAYAQGQSAMLKQGELELDVATNGFDQQILSMIPDIGATPFTEEDFKEITGQIAEPSSRFVRQVNLILETHSAERLSLRQALESKLRSEFYDDLTIFGREILAEFNPDAPVENRGQEAQEYLDALAAIAQERADKDKEIPELVESEKNRLTSDYETERQRVMDHAAEEAGLHFDKLNRADHDHKLETVELNVVRSLNDMDMAKRELAREKAQTSIEEIYEATHADILGNFQKKLDAMIADWHEHNKGVRDTIESHLIELVDAEKALSAQMKQAREESTEISDLEARIRQLEENHEATLKEITERHTKTVSDLELEKASLRSEIEAEFEADNEKLRADLLLTQDQYKNMAHITQVTSESIQNSFDQNGKTVEALNETIARQERELQQLRDNARTEASAQRRKDGWVWFTIMLIAMILAFIVGIVVF